MFMKNNQGFSLIELLIVITILGILATAGLFILNPTRIMKKSRDTKRIANLVEIQGALEMYRADSPGEYPIDAEFENELIPEYIKSMPIDPTTGDNYYYELDGGNDYILCACLELDQSVNDSVCESGLTGASCGTGLTECCTSRP